MSKVFSTEDGNLSSDIRIVKERVYSDVDLSLEARTTSDGDVYKKTDAAAVKQSVKNLLLTNFYEKPYRPTFGGNLNDLLFELGDERSGEQIISNIRDAMDRYEPRAKITNLKVNASPDYNTITIVMEFRIVETGYVDTLRVSLNQPVVDYGFVPITTPPLVFDEILLNEDSDRILTLQGLLLRIDVNQFGLLTQSGESILQQNGLEILP